MILVHEINVEPLFKAYASFERFRKNLDDEQEVSGAIKSFEYCYELSWKTMKKFLEFQGVIVASPRDCFREAARLGIIKDPVIWFEFIKKRNITVHCYEETLLDLIPPIFEEFSKEVAEFIKYIEHEKKQSTELK